MTLWLTVVAMGLVTFAIRLIPILALERFPIPTRLRQALRFVPAAVLSAIILPELLRPAGMLDISLGNLRLIAGVIAILVAWRTRNVVTIVAGWGWILQALAKGCTGFAEIFVFGSSNLPTNELRMSSTPH
jgi:branched-subunit amino acid transport protein